MNLTRSLYLAFLLCFAALSHAAEPSLAPAVADGPAYTADGKLVFPEAYREWVYLSTGLDMSYNRSAVPGHHMFSNVFVNPEAYRSFQKTGVWPDKTVIVLEVRGAAEKGSIIKGGQYQSNDLMGVEVHVRDEQRFVGNWGFFAFDGISPAELIPQSEDCYACHTAHGAVDTTFVQFYPTLLELATKKQTLSPNYLKEK